jgi:hypothetical protein
MDSVKQVLLQQALSGTIEKDKKYKLMYWISEV